MRHRIAGRKLSRLTSHRLSMYHNLVADLLKHEKIKTTEPKAKEVKGIAEKMITLGKDGSLASRRRASVVIGDKKVVDKLFDELAKRYADRNGGYVRLLKVGNRPGDGASMSIMELVQ